MPTQKSVNIQLLLNLEKGKTVGSTFLLDSIVCKA